MRPVVVLRDAVTFLPKPDDIEANFTIIHTVVNCWGSRELHLDDLEKAYQTVFVRFRTRIWPGDPSRSPGLALQLNFHKKSAPETNSNATS